MTELAKTIDQTVKELATREGKYLTFSLGREEYGISILKIKEIIGMMPILRPIRSGHAEGVEAKLPV